MPFPDNLANARKQHGLTQEALGELVGLTKLQIYRYEKGSSQPTLEVLKKIAISLHVSLDELVFDEGERDPVDDLKLRFELIQQMSQDDQNTIKSMLDGMILKHQTKLTMGNLQA
ncbi:MAG: helix-turn-helix transcriptional regulator [Pseudomonadota bacterium]